MKRFAVAAGVLLLVYFGVLFYGEHLRQLQPEFEYFLPEETMVYLHQKDLGRFATRIDNQPLLHGVRREVMAFLSENTGIMAALPQASEVNSDLRRYLLSSFFQEFLSRDFTIAILAEKDAACNAADRACLQELICKNLVFYTKTGFRRDLTRIFRRFLTSPLTDSRVTFGRHSIHHLSCGDLYLASYTMIGTRLLLAFNRDTIYSLLDRYDSKRPSLHDVVSFQTAKGRYKKSPFFLYAGGRGLAKKRWQTFQKGFPPGLRVMVEQKHPEALDSLSAGIRAERGNISLDASFSFEAAASATELNEVFAKRPERDLLLRYAPADTFLLFWKNTFDPAASWDIVRALSPAGAATFETLFRRNTDRTLTSFFPLLGSHVQFLVRAHDPVDPVPLPNFALFLEVTDRAKMRATLRAFFRKNGLPLGRDSYNGFPCYYWGDEEESGLQPVFCFLGDTLLVASSFKTFRKIIDASLYVGVAGNISAHPVLNSGFSQEKNSIAFMEAMPVATGGRVFLDWWGVMAAVQGKSASQDIERKIQFVIFPLLEELRNYEYLTFSSAAEGNILELELKLHTAR